MMQAKAAIKLIWLILLLFPYSSAEAQWHHFVDDIINLFRRTPTRHTNKAINSVRKAKNMDDLFKVANKYDDDVFKSFNMYKTTQHSNYHSAYKSYLEQAAKNYSLPNYSPSLIEYSNMMRNRAMPSVYYQQTTEIERKVIDDFIDYLYKNEASLTIRDIPISFFVDNRANPIKYRIFYNNKKNLKNYIEGVQQLHRLGFSGDNILKRNIDFVECTGFVAGSRNFRKHADIHPYHDFFENINRNQKTLDDILQGKTNPKIVKLKNDQFLVEHEYIWKGETKIKLELWKVSSQEKKITHRYFFDLNEDLLKNLDDQLQNHSFLQQTTSSQERYIIDLNNKIHQLSPLDNGAYQIANPSFEQLTSASPPLLNLKVVNSKYAIYKEGNQFVQITETGHQLQKKVLNNLENDLLQQLPTHHTIAIPLKLEGKTSTQWLVLGDRQYHSLTIRQNKIIQQQQIPKTGLQQHLNTDPFWKERLWHKVDLNDTEQFYLLRNNNQQTDLLYFQNNTLNYTPALGQQPKQLASLETLFNQKAIAQSEQNTQFIRVQKYYDNDDLVKIQVGEIAKPFSYSRESYEQFLYKGDQQFVKDFQSFLAEKQFTPKTNFIVVQDYFINPKQHNLGGAGIVEPIIKNAFGKNTSLNIVNAHAFAAKLNKNLGKNYKFHLTTNTDLSIPKQNIQKISPAKSSNTSFLKINPADNEDDFAKEIFELLDKPYVSQNTVAATQVEEYSNLIIINGKNQQAFQREIQRLAQDGKLAQKDVILMTCHEFGDATVFNSRLIEKYRVNSVMFFAHRINVAKTKKLIRRFVKALSKNEQNNIHDLFRKVVSDFYEQQQKAFYFNPENKAKALKSIEEFLYGLFQVNKLRIHKSDSLVVNSNFGQLKQAV